MKRITIKEIAKKAGVSIGTVDRVLHNRGEVAAKTKDLVLKIANEGNYTTNVYARSLKLNKTFKIAVLLPNDNEYWATQNLAVAQSAAQYESLGLELDFFTFDRHKPISLHKQAENVLSANPDGAILAPVIEDEILRLTHQFDLLQVPYVFVDSNLENTKPLSFIGQNSIQAGYLAAKLLNLGYANGIRTYIARFHDFDSLNKTIEERISGYKQFYSDNGFDQSLIDEVDLSGDSSKLISHLQGRNDSKEHVHIFIPNSRSHQIVGLLKDFEGYVRTVGFDLIKENRECLKVGALDFIIDQNPNRQGELAVRAFYNKLIVNVDVEPLQLMSLEIITKENLPGEART